MALDQLREDISAYGCLRAHFGAQQRAARLFVAMKSLPELQELTGYSRDQLKRRIALLRELGRDGVHRGTHGALLVPDDLVDLLVRMAEHERKGLAPREALAMALDSAKERCPDTEECSRAHTVFNGGTKKCPSTPTTITDDEVLRVLRALFCLLTVATAGMISIGVAALLTR